MKIGLIVDGRAEREALPHMLDKLTLSCEVVPPVLYADMQPTAPPGRIAREIVSRVRVLAQRDVRRAVVLIDSEGSTQCPGAWALAIERAAMSFGAGCRGIEIKVVVKHRALENWLLSDPAALRQMPGRFQLSATDEASVVPDKADHIDAVRLMGRIVRGSYRKREDAVRVMRRLDPLVAAQNSRSLRRLLRVLEHQRFTVQSARPWSPPRLP